MAARGAGGGPRPSRIGLPRPTTGAWVIAVLGCGILAAAINTGNNLLYLLFALLAAALPVSMAGSLLNLVRVRAVFGHLPVVEAGRPATVSVVVHNRRPCFPARGLRIEVAGPGRGWRPVSCDAIPGGGSVRLEVPLPPSPRGPLVLSGIRLRSAYPIGLLERRRFYPEPAEILVLPAAEEGGTPEAAVGGRESAAGGSTPGHGAEPEGVREAHDEDEARLIDWKATARTGRLMARATLRPAVQPVELAVTTRRPAAGRAEAEQFEAEVRRVAGTAGRALAAGAEVRLVADGRLVGVADGMEGRTPILRTLARLEATGPDGRPLPRPAPAGPAPDAVPVPLEATAAARSHGASARLALFIAATALFAYDGLGAIAFLLITAGVAVDGLRRRARRPALLQSAGLWRVAALLVLGAFPAAIVLRFAPPLAASLHLVAFIAVYAVCNARQIADDRRILLVSLLMMVLAAALTTDVSWVLFLLGWLLVATHAQVAWMALPVPGTGMVEPPSGRSPYRRPALGSSAALVATGAVIFLIVPHLGTGAFAPTGFGVSATGFTETTRLGDIGRIKKDRTPVFQVGHGGAVPEPGLWRWRGAALDTFDGREWRRGTDHTRWLTPGADGVFRLQPDRGPAWTQEIRLEPIGSRVLFAAGDPVTVTSEDLLFLAEEDGGLILPAQPSRRLQYRVEAGPATPSAEILRAATGPDPAEVLLSGFALPPLDPRIPELARTLVDGAAGRYDAARAIERWLSTERTYSLDVADAGRTDPLAAFLFDDMAGHCEYFATAMVLLARSAGIPARFVAGYIGGEQSRFSDRVTVRQSDAHAWTEVYFPGVGWVPFDPTPGIGRTSADSEGALATLRDAWGSVARVWDDYVIGVDLEDQARALLVVRDGFVDLTPGLRAGGRVALAAVLPAALLVGAAWWWRRWRTGEGHPSAGAARRREPALHRRLTRILARLGARRGPGETPLEFSRRIAARLSPEGHEQLRALIDLYYRTRFAAVEPDAGVRREAATRLAALRRDVRRQRAAGARTRAEAVS